VVLNKEKASHTLRVKQILLNRHPSLLRREGPGA